jgi:hypothetical protein
MNRVYGADSIIDVRCSLEGWNCSNQEAYALEATPFLLPPLPPQVRKQALHNALAL